MPFLYLFFASLITGMLYIHFRFIFNISNKRWVRFCISVVMLSVVLAVFLYFKMRFSGASGLMVNLLAWYGYTGIGALSFLLTLLILLDGCLIITGMVRRIKKQPENPMKKAHRRLFLKQGITYGLAGGTLMFSGKGIYNAHKTPSVKEVIIPVAGLHPDLSGVSLVQITDIHLGPTIKGDFLEKIVPIINSLSPDVIALTGDLVDGRVHELAKHTRPLTELKSTYGNFFVTGNHEYYFNGPEWCQHMETIGFSVLNNTHRLIHHQKGRMLLAGVTDLKGGRFVASHTSNPSQAMSGAPDADIKILLAHQPKSVYQAAKAGFDIQLSGHTHGGQFFPWNLVVGLEQPFIAGVYHYKHMFLYVSRGTGYWGPPMRLGSPSEITRLILKRI